MPVLREGSAGHGIPAVFLINAVLPFIVAIFLGGAVLIFDLCHQFPAVMVGLFGSSGLRIKKCRAGRNVIIGICHIAANGICQAHESAILYLYLNDASS